VRSLRTGAARRRRLLRSIPSLSPCTQGLGPLIQEAARRRESAPNRLAPLARTPPTGRRRRCNEKDHRHRTAAQGRRRFPLACWICGREVAPMRFRADDLRRQGWAPPQTLQIPDWCGCSTEYLPVPTGDDWWALVPIWEPTQTPSPLRRWEPAVPCGARTPVGRWGTVASCTVAALGESRFRPGAGRHYAAIQGGGGKGTRAHPPAEPRPTRSLAGAGRPDERPRVRCGDRGERLQKKRAVGSWTHQDHQRRRLEAPADLTFGARHLATSPKGAASSSRRGARPHP
jgi:hypothetical protein